MSLKINISHTSIDFGKMSQEELATTSYLKDISKVEITDLLKCPGMQKCKIILVSGKILSSDFSSDTTNILLEGIDSEKIINNSSYEGSTRKPLEEKIITVKHAKLADELISLLFRCQTKGK